MITITSTATAVPPNVLSRELVKEYYGRTFSLSDRRLQAMFEILDNSRIDRRHSFFPVDYLIQPRSLTLKNSEYREHAIALSRQVAEQALARANRDPSEVDMIVTVSCTGFMIPSVEAYLIGDMGFRPDVRRLPITELGCAAGAVGLTRAWEYLRAYPKATVLLIAVELPSLTFQRRRLSQANLISAALFGDGAAAAVISDGAGNRPGHSGQPKLSLSVSIDAMGFDLQDDRLSHRALQGSAAAHPRTYRRPCSKVSSRGTDSPTKQIKAFVLHPGGQKLLGFMQEELGLCACQVQPSWDVLREYGNLSSASVLFVLHEWLTRGEVKAGERGLLAAFGPGFSAEMLLLQWT